MTFFVAGVPIIYNLLSVRVVTTDLRLTYLLTTFFKRTNNYMKRKLLQESLDLSTEIHALINQVPEDKASEDTEQVKTLSLAVQSHLVRSQKREAEELLETLQLALASITELEEKMLETVKQRRLKKMAINPMLAKMKELETEIKILAGMRV